MNKDLSSIVTLDRLGYVHYTWSTNKECDTEHNQNIEKIVECFNNGTKCLPNYSSVCNIFENNFLRSDKYEITLYPVFHTKEYFIKYLMSNDYAANMSCSESDCVKENNGTHYHEQLFNINNESLILRKNTFTANETFDLNFSGWSIANSSGTENYGVKYKDCQMFNNDQIRELIKYIEESNDVSTLELYTVWK